MKPRFRWLRKDASRDACVCMTVARMRCEGMTLERALNITLPKHSKNPEAISAAERKRLENSVKEVMEGRTRRQGIRASGH